MGQVSGSSPIVLFLIMAAVFVLFLLIRTASSNRRHVMRTDQRLCRGCGTSHPAFAAFCRRCGRKL
jgi:hypothetical protein